MWVKKQNYHHQNTRDLYVTWNMLFKKNEAYEVLREQFEHKELGKIHIW